VPTEVAFRLCVSLIDTAPCGAKKKVRDMARVQALPLCNLGSGFVFLRPTNQCWSKRGKLFEDVLFQHGADISRGCKVALSTRVAALAAHVDQIGEWLSSGSSFVEICPLSTERVRRNYSLRFELVVTHGTTKLYLTQRCHRLLLPIGARTLGNREGISVP
jgi:hypothetical protein